MCKALFYLFLNISNRYGLVRGMRARRLKRLQNVVGVPGTNEIDDAVVRAFSQGDDAAFKQIYDRYAPAIYRVVSRYFRSPVLAEDLLLELFSAFRLKREGYTEAAQLRLSLFTMARNLAIQYLGKVTAEVLAVQRATGEKEGTATADILPAGSCQAAEYTLQHRSGGGCNPMHTSQAQPQRWITPFTCMF